MFELSVTRGQGSLIVPTQHRVFITLPDLFMQHHDQHESDSPDQEPVSRYYTWAAHVASSSYLIQCLLSWDALVLFNLHPAIVSHKSWKRLGQLVHSVADFDFIQHISNLTFYMVGTWTVSLYRSNEASESDIIKTTAK